MDASPAILIVEDDDLVRSFLCRALSGVADTIDACATGAEALAAVQRRRYGAILLDGLLPDTHGIDLGRRILDHPNGVHSGICFVSGSLRRALAMRHGVSALPKPLRLRELIDVVEQLLVWHNGAGDSIAERRAALDELASELLVR